MARKFAPNQYIDFGAIGVASTTKATFVVSFRRNATGNGVYWGCGSSFVNRLLSQVYTDGNCYVNVGDGAAGAYGYFATNDANWHRQVVVYDGSLTGNANRLKVFQDGAQKTLTFGANPVPASCAAGGNWMAGRDEAGANYTTGALADMGVWKATALSDADALSLSVATSALLVQPAYLTFYAPLIGTLSPEPDVRGKFDGTLTNTPTSEAHPRIYYRAGRRVTVDYTVAAGGGLFVNPMSGRGGTMAQPIWAQ